MKSINRGITAARNRRCVSGFIMHNGLRVVGKTDKSGTILQLFMQKEKKKDFFISINYINLYFWALLQHKVAIIPNINLILKYAQL